MRRNRRLLGWLLSLLTVLCWASPQATMLRALPTRLNIAQGQQTDLPGGFPLSVQLREDGVAAISSDDESLVRLRGDSVGESTATISLLGLLPIRDVEIAVSDDQIVYPGGQAIGVALHTKGVLVVGTSDLSTGVSPARLAGLRAGDLITRADQTELTGADQLTHMVASAAGRPMALTVRRGAEQLTLTLNGQLDKQSGVYRIGAWVRDSTAGVGTLSFYAQADNRTRFGALGHAITDADTQQILTVGDGRLMRASIVDVVKGRRGFPGELKGSFLRENVVLGALEVNNEFGVYGSLTEPPTHPLYPDGLPIGRKDAVHTGAASILCTLAGETMDEYAIEIVEVARQSVPAQRSMIVKVTDERLLERTGGIVQGMSGSPILQDGRLIGAVTHV